MCGITGFFGFGDSAAGADEILGRMLHALHHRGPDGAGQWTDAPLEVALGHRRLAIIDLTPTGAQPMVSASGRFVISFNGEIYNFPEIRRDLEAAGVRFRGGSDTEVLLEAAARWGVRQAITRCVGMFAVALFDREERKLYLVRDRLGEKPLYYGWMGRTFLFGSELKALRAHPAWRGEVDRDALRAFFRHSFVPAPLTIYRGIAKLPAGGLLELSLADARPGVMPAPQLYWDLAARAAAARQQPFAGNDAEALAELDRVLGRAIREQMVADVPLGAFLSGGIDSSTIVALMQRANAGRVRTFTIGFAESEYNEAEHAKAVAQHLGTEHTELYVRPQDALDVIPRLPSIYDEPFADSSQIPTFLVSALARRHVTVSLSGDAGDELFAGYRRYFDTAALWRKTRWMPRWLGRAAGGGLGAVPPATWEALLGRVMPAVAGAGWKGRTGDRLHKVADLLAFPSAADLYLRFVLRDAAMAGLVRGDSAADLLPIQRAAAAIGDDASLVARMTQLDLASYLPDCILTKVDRAAMAVSLETRVPLLDHRVVEFALGLPDRFKVRQGQGKWLLRQLLYRHVPPALLERPKMGFGVPIESWLRGPLKDWGEALLDERRLRDEGFLDPQPIRQMWREHLTGTRRWHYALWDVLMFQAWLEHSRQAIPLE